MVKFSFQVGEPQQRGGSSPIDRPYWVYTVACKTDHEKYPKKDLQVCRRYRDFEWFRNQLGEQYPFCIIPPIPAKDFGGTVEKFVPGSHNPSLLSYRQRALKKFLSRVGAHIHLQHSTLLEEFLEMDEPEWDRRTKEPRRTGNIESVLSSFSSAVTTQWNPQPVTAESNQSYSKAISRDATLPSNPQVWEETKVYIGQLEQSVTVLKDRLDQLVRRRKGTSTALNDFGRNFQNVGTIEAQLDNSGETSLSRAAMSVGRHAQELSTIYAEHANQETNTVVEALQYYVGICGACRETLKRLQGVMVTRDTLAKAAETAKQNKEKLISKGAGQDKIAGAEAECAQLTSRLDESSKHVETFERQFREELKKFHREKQYDMKEILKQFVSLQKDYSDRMKRSWDDLIPTVEDVRT